MSDTSIGMICAAAICFVVLFFRWVDRRSGRSMHDTSALVKDWRKDGGDKAGLFALGLAVLGALVVASIPRIVTILLLLRGHVAAATAFLLTSLAWSVAWAALGVAMTKHDVDETFDKEKL